MSDLVRVVDDRLSRRYTSQLSAVTRLRTISRLKVDVIEHFNVVLVDVKVCTHHAAGFALIGHGLDNLVFDEIERVLAVLLVTVFDPAWRVDLLCRAFGNFVRVQSTTVTRSSSLRESAVHFNDKDERTQACVQLRTYSTGMASPSRQAGSSMSSPYLNWTTPPTEFRTLRSYCVERSSSACEDVSTRESVES
jgi:hypothetical protein